MLGLAKIAVTGGISCGKSTVCDFFKEFGAHVESADDIVHQLLSSVRIKAGKFVGPQDHFGNKLIELLGQDVIIDDQLDRYQIAKKVFKNPKLLEALEKIIHPEVRLEINKRYQQVIQSEKAPLFVVEIPLLFESGMKHDFNYTVAVVADEKTCKERFLQHPSYDVAEYEKRSARQMNMNDKADLADFVIDNSGSLKELREAVKSLYNQLKTKKESYS